MKDASLLIRNGINIEGSLELFGDMEMYNETLNDFLNCIDKKIADIKRYKESSDMPNYAILVHSLKSDSKYLGFTNLQFCLISPILKAPISAINISLSLSK